jgi:hypothetical protein
MPIYLPFVISVFFSLLVWSLVLRRWLWPWLNRRPLAEAVEPLLYLHAFRFIGLAFLVPGVVGPGLNRDWAAGAAWGDLVTALLALLLLGLRRSRALRPGLWIFSVVGIGDLLRALVLGPLANVVPDLHATYFIPVLGVPLLLVTHATVVALLLRSAAIPQRALGAQNPV